MKLVCVHLRLDDKEEDVNEELDDDEGDSSVKDELNDSVDRALRVKFVTKSTDLIYRSCEGSE